MALLSPPAEDENVIDGQFDDAEEDAVVPAKTKTMKQARTNRKAPQAKPPVVTAVAATAAPEDDEDYDDEDYDDLEVSLRGEGGALDGGVGGGGGAGAAFAGGKKMNFGISQAAANDLRRSEQGTASGRDPRHTGRDDRATSEQVMDPRTRLVLFKVLRRLVLFF